MCYLCYAKCGVNFDNKFAPSNYLLGHGDATRWGCDWMGCDWVGMRLGEDATGWGCDWVCFLCKSLCFEQNRMISDDFRFSFEQNRTLSDDFRFF